MVEDIYKRRLPVQLHTGTDSKEKNLIVESYFLGE